MQTSARRLGAAACAVVVMAFVCVPVVLGQEAPPTDPPQARIGHPPGVSSSSTITRETSASVPPGQDMPAPGATVSTNARMGHPPGSSAEARSSMWQVFLTWLRTQTRSIANQ